MTTALLRRTASWRVLEGFGGASRAACRYVQVQSADELAEVFLRAKAEGLTVTLRGAGRSYGDAALNRDGLVVDTTALSRVLSWEPETGTLEAEPGLTIEGVWRRTLEDGYWPAVVPGTMKPTLGGCLSTNVHGKNNFREGTFGEHVEELELLTPIGERRVLSRTKDAELFHAVIGGLGLLGAITRVKLNLKRIESGRLEVHPSTAGNLDALFRRFEDVLPHSDYAVAWVDCHATGSRLGRSVLHSARHLTAAEDGASRGSLHVEAQRMRSTLFGFPRRHVWKLLRPLTNRPGTAALNALKYHSARLQGEKRHSETLAAFSFLLDSIPDWRLAYGRHGFIQYQLFLPRTEAADCFRATLERCQQAGLIPSLGVLKRHRADPFLLSHGLDGWSLALDFRVTRENGQRLWALTEELSEGVLQAGGKFYLAKDSVLRPHDVERAYGREVLSRFFLYKRRLDPTGLLSSDLARRVLAPWARGGAGLDRLGPSGKPMASF